MVNMIKDATNTRIVIGQNGLIWIEGQIEGVTKATSAIELIKSMAHTNGLTDRMTEFLKIEKKGEE